MKINSISVITRKSNFAATKKSNAINFGANPIHKSANNLIVSTSALLFTIGMFYPANILAKQTDDKINEINIVNNRKPLIIDKVEDLIPELNIVTEINFRGGKTYKYDEFSIEKLKELLTKPTDKISYTAPIENAKNVFLCDFGMFGARRPGGRPHMGLDIFVSPMGRKPKTPVSILAPVDGIVISSKKANENNNLVANTITILGVDGRQYSFDHMARMSDYPNDEQIELPPSVR